MPNIVTSTSGGVVPLADGGASFVEQGTPLARNNWFDGKFLRADDLAREQNYHRAALRLANQAGGFGIVQGLEVALSAAGAEIAVQPGLAVAASGQLILVGTEFAVAVDALIAATRAIDRMRLRKRDPAAFDLCEAAAAAAEDAPLDNGLQIYRITIASAEALCGYEDVYGSLCERACVTETQRPYRLEGALLRARLETLALPDVAGYAVGAKHLRSRVVSALFRRDDAAIFPLPDDGRLLSALWCRGTGFEDGDEVTLGYLVRRGGVNAFVDLWSGRRERMTTQAENYWRRRTRMRPLAAFFAQVAQFQCQLPGALGGGVVPAGGDDEPCAELRALVDQLTQEIETAQKDDVAAASDRVIEKSIGSPLMRKLGDFASRARTLIKFAPQQVLLDGGIVELPPAGFLPVTPEGGDVEAQVRALTGKGVELQVCTAPLDAIGHLFEEARHSARINLTEGLANPGARPRMQVIVPDGALADKTVAAADDGYAVEVLEALPFVMVALDALRGDAPAPAPAAAVDAAVDAANQPSAAELRERFIRSDTAGMFKVDTTATRDTVLGRGAARAAPIAGRPALALAAGSADAAQTEESFVVNRDGPSLSRQARPFGELWLDLRCDDVFAATEQSPAQLDAQARLSILMPPEAGELQGKRVTYELRLTGTLTPMTLTPVVERAFTRSTEAVLGYGGALRVAMLDATLSTEVRLDGVPTVGDRPATETIRASVLLVKTTDGERWALTAGREDSTAAANLLWEFDRRAAAQTVTLRLVPSEAGLKAVGIDEPLDQALADAALAPKLRQVMRARPVARLYAHRAARADGETYRGAALDAATELAQTFDDPAFEDTVRARLFPQAEVQLSQRVRARHDWVLFRRPVAAQCSVPVAAPAVRTRYRASVLRLANLGSASAVEMALEALQRGAMPSNKVASFAIAGDLLYAPDAAAPDQAIAEIKPAFTASGFGRRALIACVQGDPLTDDALEKARFGNLARDLGGLASGQNIDVRMLPRLPAQMLTAAANGAVVFLVQPPPPAPPAPDPGPSPTPAPSPGGGPIRHLHRVIAAPAAARRKVGRDFASLAAALAGSVSANTVVDELIRAGATDLMMLNFIWTGNGATLGVDGADLARIRQLTGSPGNLEQPPRIVAIAQKGATDEELRQTEQEARFLINDLISGPSSGAAPQIRADRAAFELSITSGSVRGDALTVIFTKA